ncbi:MAG: glutathione S-transferase N-terminal domain-containing protein [Pleurocapsa sp. MO_226.B13]|nr:glutathione S-transferase N-terminal domain-containing protein [Pleurocapsa sp. MO_226.B13]
MYKLYDFLPSGNGCKVRLLLTQLEIPFELIQLDILKQKTRTPEFLAKNPNRKIPFSLNRMRFYIISVRERNIFLKINISKHE